MQLWHVAHCLVRMALWAQVCRTIRQLYPDSGVPVIMISAKSKEEDIVEGARGGCCVEHVLLGSSEACVRTHDAPAATLCPCAGLASGANDYVVKPFGRSEILARITTHLQLHDRTHHVSHMARWGRAACGACLLRAAHRRAKRNASRTWVPHCAAQSAEGEGRRSDCAASPLLPLLAVPARGGGLPPRMAAGMQTTQLFDQVRLACTPPRHQACPSRPLAPHALGNAGARIAAAAAAPEQVTVVAWHVTNLAELASHVASEDLAAALTALHIQADQLLDSWGLYCPDDPNQDYCVVVSGEPRPLLRGGFAATPHERRPLGRQRTASTRPTLAALARAAPRAAGLHGRDHPHVMRALDFCRSLLKAAADLPPLPPSPRSAAPPPGAAATAAAPLRLEVACGVHALSAQGVLVGATHPVMHVGGPVLHMAVQLMHASEPGCAHVSHKVHKAAVAADELLAPAGWVGDHRTYVLKAGGAWQDALHVIVGRCSE